MEVFTKPPFRESRPGGRPAKLSTETRLLVGRKVTSKELTYREAAKVFGVSCGAVGACAKFYKTQKKYGRSIERKKESNTEIANYRHLAQVKELKEQIADLFIENQVLKKILNKSLVIKENNKSIVTTENLAQYQEDAES